MRIYLDNCCFNRPFDDQGQTRVRIEAEAKLSIQAAVRGGRLELAWSYMLDFENQANPFENRRDAIGRWKRLAVVDVAESDLLLQGAHDLVAGGFKAKDSLHLACAIAAGCVYFITTDDAVLRSSSSVPGIGVVDPVFLVRELRL